MLDLLSRQKPKVINNYMTGSVFINCYLSGKPARLWANIKDNEYQIKRTGQLRYFDSSRKRIGKQAFCNRIDEVVRQFNTEWRKMNIKDTIRIFLKKTFSVYCDITYCDLLIVAIVIDQDAILLTKFIRPF